jgi:hypothetical protein
MDLKEIKEIKKVDSGHTANKMLKKGWVLLEIKKEQVYEKDPSGAGPVRNEYVYFVMGRVK